METIAIIKQLDEHIEALPSGTMGELLRGCKRLIEAQAEDLKFERKYTMTNDEINQKVHELLGSPYLFGPQYCTNPMIAWPLIVENKISLEYTGNWSRWLASMRYRGCWATHENPLVAAMLVFIELKESEDD